MISASKRILIIIITLVIIFSCTTDSQPDEQENPVQEDIIFIPDENFRNTLLNENCVDNNGDSIPEKSVDSNNDGKIQRSEAEAVINLILEFDYGSPVKFVDLKGIEHFINIKKLELTSSVGYLYEENIDSELISYDLTNLKKLEYLQINHLSTDFFENLDLSGLNKLVELNLSNNRPGGTSFVDDEYNPIYFLNVNLEGCDILKKFSLVNSFLKINFCQTPSLEELNMEYLEGGEPDIIDLHCLKNLKWLNISENFFDELILKNSSVLETFIANDVGSIGIYPYLYNICIDDIPEEYEQIAVFIGDETTITTVCSFE
ncbi:hypothetical protein [Christiangramia sp. SM2212]|uniref:Leucine-rich repeat domain-containing protein n=1 Tax=Christiangramia sediminicola TaxID=3073267 RepID=A0ABU1EP53_9FLAO|nr:hypothetical protein [Christiangramia sp. SM2212]MDR5589928.1 hypothetical protein [Christiangramia sp. SM2212]